MTDPASAAGRTTRPQPEKEASVRLRRRRGGPNNSRMRTKSREIAAAKHRGAILPDGCVELRGALIRETVAWNDAAVVRVCPIANDAVDVHRSAI